MCRHRLGCLSIALRFRLAPWGFVRVPSRPLPVNPIAAVDLFKLALGL